MGIYIKGLEMPTEGGEIRIFADGSVWVNAWPTRGYMRIENASAIPVPPHGRLIDADSLGFVLMDCENADNALWRLDEAPTVIPADPAEEATT